MPINTIIFDLGNVLISYQPHDFHIQLGDSPEKTEAFLKNVYGGPEWQLIDKGVMSVEEAVQSIASRSSLSQQEIARIFDLRGQLLTPIHRNIKLLKSLKKGGLRLYFLSNFPVDMFAILVEKYDFFGQFDGGVYSAAVKVLKPDPEIFRILIRKYNLAPDECLFIDDLNQNIRAAESEGFMTLHLTSHDILEEELRSLIPGAFVNS